MCNKIQPTLKISVLPDRFADDGDDRGDRRRREPDRGLAEPAGRVQARTRSMSYMGHLMWDARRD